MGNLLDFSEFFPDPGSRFPVPGSADSWRICIQNPVGTLSNQGRKIKEDAEATSMTKWGLAAARTSTRD